MKGPDGLKVYGSGLLSSHGEIAHAIDSPMVQRYPIQLEWVVNQYFEIDHYQPAAVRGGLVRPPVRAGQRAGGVDAAGTAGQRVPGEPAISEPDLRSFLEASAGK
jgi:phenylalanine-4-hydroxylase